ncbi:MAG: hypothetical protein HZY75_00115 [Nocardioidaceae bacterium]|nr:MAG: hypothetical protein HZY75_00115 [Nocardioidaceae bacterium]
MPNITGIPLDPTDGPSGEGEITLNADQTAVAPGEQISFSGAYDAEDGTVLQIQRREGAAWIDFPAEATVRNGAFTTYVFTSRTGDNIWRLFDPDTGRSSIR